MRFLLTYTKMLIDILKHHIIRNLPRYVRNKEDTLSYVLRKKIPGNLDDFSGYNPVSTFDKKALLPYFPHTAVPFKIFVTSDTGI